MNSMHRGFLDDCEKEQLQHSGEIQSYGALLILSKHFELTHWSENFTEFTGFDPEDLAQSISNRSFLPALTAFPTQVGHRSELLSGLDSKKGLFDLVITRGNDETLLIEFFRSINCGIEWKHPPDMSGGYDPKTIQTLREELVVWIAEVTGFDRVMYYQFLSEGDGEVVAEVSKNDQGSYLGLRFPASDIPQIARQLYLKNPWRVIHNAQAFSVTLLGKERADLTWSDLRSVSPVHAIYMQNMGDQSSLSFPISAGQDLDALISCHSHQPHLLPLERLCAIREVVVQFNRLLRNVMTASRLKLVDELTFHSQQVLKAMRQHQDAQTQWQTLSQWLLDEFEADAAVLCYSNQHLYAGQTVEASLIDQLDDWFSHKSEELVFYKNRIRDLISSDILTHYAGAAGLKVRTQDKQGTRLFLLRLEQVEEVVWGGNPDKPAEFHDGIYGIAPRRSFSKWVEKRMGYSREWGNATRLKLLRLRDELQKVTPEHLAPWLSASEKYHG